MTEPTFNITWDSVKANTNLNKHGVTFAQAATVILDPLALTVFDKTHCEQEERWFTLGQSSDGRLLAVAHTYDVMETQAEAPQRIAIRLISAREATHREKHNYENS